jgi:hypothetical protein
MKWHALLIPLSAQPYILPFIKSLRMVGDDFDAIGLDDAVVGKINKYTYLGMYLYLLISLNCAKAWNFLKYC